MGEPTVGATGAPPREVVDALSTLIGAGKARAARVAISFVASTLARSGLGISVAGNPALGLLVDAAVTGAISGFAKGWRDGRAFGRDLPRWIPRLPGWIPL